MQLHCQIQLPDQSSLERNVSGSSIRIGRGASCELCITGHAGDVVSELHARIEQTPKGLLLTDLQSSNGTYLNDQKVEKPVAVKEGDLIRLGKQGPRLLLMRVDLLGNGEPRVLEPLVVGGPARMGNGAWGASVAQRRPSLVHPLPGTPAAAEPYSGPVLPLADSPAAAAPASEAGSATRGLVVEMQQRHKQFSSSLGIAGAAVLLVLVSALGALGWMVSRASQARPPEEVYKKMLRACVWVVYEPNESEKKLARALAKNPTKIGDVQFGSGALIDLSRKLAFTNFHVIALNGIPAKEVTVYFPEIVNGAVEKERKNYLQHSRAIRARVVVSDPTVDLAILELDALPETAISLSLSKRGAEEGQPVFLIGNPGLRDVLWIFSTGKVRTLAHEQTAYPDEAGFVQEINAWLVKTDMATNPGDSGGPVCNDRVELVGVNSSHKTDQRLVTNAIDVREVKRLLNLAGVPYAE